MKIHFNDSEKLNDLIFENRNKNYGAYALRKLQGDNLSKALFSSLAFFALIAFGAFWFSQKTEVMPGTDDGNIIPEIFKEILIDVTPPETKIEKKEKITTEAPKTFSGEMKASDEQDKTLDKTTDQMNFSKDPNPNGSDSVITDKDLGLISEKRKTDPGKIEHYVSHMPDMLGMKEFINRNLNYPPFAVENGTQGTVYLTFVVEKDGTLTDIKLLKGIGDGCEEEAMRVVKLMPKWNPGINNGEPVRVQCNLPVRFKLK